MTANRPGRDARDTHSSLRFLGEIRDRPMPTEKWSARPTVFGVVPEPDLVSFLRPSSQRAVANVRAPYLSSHQGCKVDINARIAKHPNVVLHTSRLLFAANGSRDRAGTEWRSQSGPSSGIRRCFVAQLAAVPSSGHAL